MFSKKGSLSVTKGKPLIARQQTIEVKASSTEEFLKAEKFEKSEQGGSAACNLIYSAAGVQGFRSRMQDDYVCTPNFTIKGSPYSYFGVFDGHGENGEIVSQHCADSILKQLIHRKVLRNSRVATNEVLAASMHKTLVKLDCQLRRTEGDKQTSQFTYGGTTACIVLISQEDIMFVNVGDSRAVLCRDGGVIFETKDHNPDVPEEEERITAGGGTVHTTPSKQKIITDKDGFNNLCVSRTIGDFNFKNSTDLPPELQPVTPAPEIDVVSRDLSKDQFLVVASDGIYKSLSSTQVVQFVLRQLMITDDLTKICRNLIDTAYFAEGNIPDDTTVILIKFPGAPSLSKQAIAEERQLNFEAIAAVEQELREMIGKADNVRAVDNDFSILQRLVKKLPEKYRVQERVSFIIETAAKLRTEKFGPSRDGQTLLTGNKSSSTTMESTTSNERTKNCDSEEEPNQDTTDTKASAVVKESTKISSDNDIRDSNKDSSHLLSDSARSHSNSGSRESSVESGERLQYCVIGTSDGELEEQKETVSLSFKN